MPEYRLVVSGEAGSIDFARVDLPSAGEALEACTRAFEEGFGDDPGWSDAEITRLDSEGAETPDQGEDD